MFESTPRCVGWAAKLPMYRLSCLVSNLRAPNLDRLDSEFEAKNTNLTSLTTKEEHDT